MQLGLARSETTIAEVATPPPMGRCASIYAHVPFCFHKCHYCDFYSLVDDDSRHPIFVNRLIAELRAARPHLADSIDTVFFGGGTPSLLAPQLWRRLLADLNEVIRLSPQAEFTIEANPETVTDDLAESIAAGGVNRISIGCQSFNPTHLKTLERWHEPANVERSMTIFRSAGLKNLNLDLIFGIPGQSLAEWLDDLNQALDLGPTHISCYGLTYESNTPLYVKMKAGRITPIDEDIEADMYEATMDTLAAAGFVQYELSNWSRPGMTCRHNLVYWTNGDWWPVGPSASGHVDGLRWKNVPRLSDYVDRPESASNPEQPFRPAIQDVERVDESTRIGERFMLGLRLIDGLPLSLVSELLAGESSARRVSDIERFVDQALLERTRTHLRLTRVGRMQANVVVGALI
jgi:oxygen-independent coproporphyrinogen III oxidase